MHYMDNQSRAVLIGERIFNETDSPVVWKWNWKKYTMKVQIESRVWVIWPSTTSPYRCQLPEPSFGKPLTE